MIKRLKTPSKWLAAIASVPLLLTLNNAIASKTPHAGTKATCHIFGEKISQAYTYQCGATSAKELCKQKLTEINGGPCFKYYTHQLRGNCRDAPSVTVVCTYKNKFY